MCLNVLLLKYEQALFFFLLISALYTLRRFRVRVISVVMIEDILRIVFISNLANYRYEHAEIFIKASYL